MKTAIYNTINLVHVFSYTEKVSSNDKCNAV